MCFQLPNPNAPGCGGGGGCTDNFQCQDGDPCTTDQCVGGACKSEPNPNEPGCGGGGCKANSDCNDFDPCTVETCSNGACSSSPTTGPGCGPCTTTQECDDGNACTEDFCGGICQHMMNPSAPGCVQTCTVAADCYVVDPCQIPSCTAGKCAFAFDSATCCKVDSDCKSDGKPCTQDACYGQKCQYLPLPGCGPCTDKANCEDNDPCTTDACDAGTCTHVADNSKTGCCKSDADCEKDGDPCTKDVCYSGMCYGGPVQGCGKCSSDNDCYDGNACTTDSCTAGTCAHEEICAKCTQDSDCAATNACTKCNHYTAPGFCSMDTSNIPSPTCAKTCKSAGDCDDSDACTTDFCVLVPATQGTMCGHTKKANCTAETTCDDAADCYNECIAEGLAGYFCAAMCVPSDQNAAVQFAALTNCFAKNGGLGTLCQTELKACGGTCAQATDCPGAPGCLVASCNAGACDYAADPTCTTCTSPAACPYDPTGCQTATCIAGKCGSKTALPYPTNCQSCTVAEDCTQEACRTKSCEASKCVVTLETDGTLCDDGNACTGTYATNEFPGAKDYCQYGKCYAGYQDMQGSPCNDGSPCTTDDKCVVGYGTCAGADKCNDGNSCTLDACDAATSNCTNVAQALACEDGDPCTKGDTCAEAACKAGGPNDCQDGDLCHFNPKCLAGYGCVYEFVVCPDDNTACTTPTCDSDLGCGVAITPESPCQPSDPCGLGTCDVTGICQTTGVVPCPDDGNACTSEVCAKEYEFSELACTHPAIEGMCDDGTPCTLVDGCINGSCFGTGPKCDDGNPCTDDSCNEATGACTNTPNSAPCAADDNVCTDDVCAAAACSHPANTAPCADDGNSCTADLCGGGTCTHPGTIVGACEVGNICTDDICDAGTCKAGQANTAPCDDAEPCTSGDTCGGGTCQPGGPKNCEDNNDCTSETCVTGQGCKYTPLSNANYCDKGCNPGDQNNYPGCKDCGGYGCYGELIGGHYCGNPAGTNKGMCQP